MVSTVMKQQGLSSMMIASAYHAYLTAKKKRKQEREEIEGMKKDISEIKNLLAHIADKL